MKLLLPLLLLLATAIPVERCAAQERIKIGVSTALTGDAAPFGNDIKNALIVANDVLLNGKYQFIFEDEQCKSREAIAAAQKFISIDKVRYVMGFPCNQTLFATAPLYEKAETLVMSSSATSGDVADMGKRNFRLFPTDAGAAAKLFEYVSKHSKRIFILTEQDQFPTMMERTFKRLNDQSGGSLKITSESFVQGETDLKAILLRALRSDIDSVYINSNTETSYISAIKQLHALKNTKMLYSAYYSSSPVVTAAVGADQDGVIFSNLAGGDELASESGKRLLAEFKKRFGEPQAGFPVAPITMESLRILDLAIQSGKDPAEYLLNRTVTDGLIPEYRIDEHGAAQGMPFEIQKIENGKVVVLHE